MIKKIIFATACVTLGSALSLAAFINVKSSNSVEQIGTASTTTPLFAATNQGHTDYRIARWHSYGGLDLRKIPSFNLHLAQTFHIDGATPNKWWGLTSNIDFTCTWNTATKITDYQGKNSYAVSKDVSGHTFHSHTVSSDGLGGFKDYNLDKIYIVYTEQTQWFQIIMDFRRGKEVPPDLNGWDFGDSGRSYISSSAVKILNVDIPVFWGDNKAYSDKYTGIIDSNDNPWDSLKSKFTEGPHNSANYHYKDLYSWSKNEKWNFSWGQFNKDQPYSDVLPEMTFRPIILDNSTNLAKHNENTSVNNQYTPQEVFDGESQQFNYPIPAAYGSGGVGLKSWEDKGYSEQKLISNWYPSVNIANTWSNLKSNTLEHNDPKLLDSINRQLSAILSLTLPKVTNDGYGTIAKNWEKIKTALNKTGSGFDNSLKAFMANHSATNGGPMGLADRIIDKIGSSLDFGFRIDNNVDKSAGGSASWLSGLGLGLGLATGMMFPPAGPLEALFAAAGIGLSSYDFASSGSSRSVIKKDVYMSQYNNINTNVATSLKQGIQSSLKKNNSDTNIDNLSKFSILNTDLEMSNVKMFGYFEAAQFGTVGRNLAEHYGGGFKEDLTNMHLDLKLQIEV